MDKKPWNQIEVKINWRCTQHIYILIYILFDFWLLSFKFMNQTKMKLNSIFALSFTHLCILAHSIANFCSVFHSLEISHGTKKSGEQESVLQFLSLINRPSIFNTIQLQIHLWWRWSTIYFYIIQQMFIDWYWYECLKPVDW